MLLYLIDDDHEDQEIFDMALNETGIASKLECYNSATSALRALEQSDALPDFIFLDLNMPKINGLQCLQMISEGNYTRKSRVIIYSTSSNEKDVNQAKALGAHEYLVKPTNFKNLINSITQILSD